MLCAHSPFCVQEAKPGFYFRINSHKTVVFLLRNMGGGGGGGEGRGNERETERSKQSETEKENGTAV